MSAKITMPSEVNDRVGAFDRFAEKVAEIASRAWFFVFCVLLVVLWAPSTLFLGNIDTWQLIINTATTIITFLLVALLQNTQTRRRPRPRSTSSTRSPTPSPTSWSITS